MRLSKRIVTISFGLGIMICVCLVSVLWYLDSSLRDDVFNGRLKIKLARQLRQDEDASGELGRLVSGWKLISWNINGMEEGARGSEAAMGIYEELYKKAYSEIAVRLAQFAREHSDTTAGLTAKLLYREVVPSMTGWGAITEEAERRSANCSLFSKEIVNQHPKTWQATEASFALIRDTAGSDEEEYVRLALEQLVKGIAEPNQADPDYESYCQWFDGQRYSLRATALCSIAVCQSNLGDARGETDPHWLKEAKKTYEQLLEEYTRLALQKAKLSS